MKQEDVQRTLCGTVGDIAFTGIFDNDTYRSEDAGRNPKIHNIVSNLYKTTFYQLLTSVRLEHAKELLLTSNMPIKEVAYQVGYDSSTGFFVAFKKKYGVTPGEFCKMEKQQRNRC